MKSTTKKRLTLTISYDELKKLCTDAYTLGKNDAWKYEFETWWANNIRPFLDEEVRRP